MVDVLDEIEFLKNVLIAMREGASDEKADDDGCD